MPEEITTADLRARLAMIETMMAEGRRSTSRYGGIFVLWGVALILATVWSSWGPSRTAWSITMPTFAAIMAILISRKRRGLPISGLSRAVTAVWCASGIALMLVLSGLSSAGHYETHVFLAIVGGILGLANFASSITLRWWPQLFCAVVWWISALAACFVNERQAGWVFIVAVFLCQIIFGVYVMIAERHFEVCSERSA